MRQRGCALALAALLALSGASRAEWTEADARRYGEAKDAAVACLAAELASFRQRLYVYRDFALTENRFTQKARMAGTDASRVPDMNENWTEAPCRGRSCIRCEVDAAAGDWGGWLFLNGCLPEGETVPRLNAGDASGQGLDLTGAAELRFFARGEKGGEKIEFFCCGFGRDGKRGNALVPYPDSAATRWFPIPTARQSKRWARSRSRRSGRNTAFRWPG